MVSPKPGKEGAMMWCVGERRGIRVRNWLFDEGKPCRRRRGGEEGGPAVV